LVMTLLLKIHCNVNHDFFALIEKWQSKYLL
jgi:hypothetical protein